MSRAILGIGIGKLLHRLVRSRRSLPHSPIPPTAPLPSGARSRADRATGGQLADITDLSRPEFGADFRRRFPDDNAGFLYGHRKLWEFAWLADRFARHRLEGDFLGLGVGHEALIFHLAHLGRSVVATDLYSTGTAWREARMALDAVFEASLFPYPRERLSVRNADMRRLDFPADSFDAIWSCSSVEHVQTLPQFVQIFREIHRVLRPGGLALITTEFSLGDPYFTPGVLSLWKDSALFGDQLRGLTLEGPVDLTYREEMPGNRPTPRRDVHRLALLGDFAGGPSGLCIHVGYTRTIPIALALRKTGPVFGWPEYLGAPAWYLPFAAGTELLANPGGAAEAADRFRSALHAADTPGARLHCYRGLIEAHVHAQQVRELHATLAECRDHALEFPEDDDALDLIAYVAAGAGYLTLARRLWERAAASPSALAASRLRIRLSQLEAELAADPQSPEVRHLTLLAEAAWCEALDFLGAGDSLLVQLGERFTALRQRHHLGTAREKSV